MERINFHNNNKRERERFHSYAYRHNDEIKPAPSVGEELLEAVCEPFEDDFESEDKCENLVGDVEEALQLRTLIDVLVLDSERQTAQYDGHNDEHLEHLVFGDKERLGSQLIP